MKAIAAIICYTLCVGMILVGIYYVTKPILPQGKSLGWHPTYTRDPRTGFCFAKAGGGGSSVVTTVPCTSMVEFLIEQSGGEPVSEQTTK